MARQSSSPSPRLSAWLVAAMLVMVALPAAITLHTVRAPGRLVVKSANPSPHGYTWSLLLFIVPILVIALWFLPRERVEVPRKAFWWTIAILTPLGWGLDFVFAHRFFEFKNTDATLSWRAPALGGGVPVEEYVFYLTGFLCVLLLYIWLDEYWMAAYNVADYRAAAQLIPRLLCFHPESVVAGAALIAAAVLYKKALSPHPEGFPWYFTFLVVAALAPSASFFPTVRAFINWRAFSLTMFVILLVSLLWEATLAVPYNWWNFQEQPMIGLRIGAWADLPVEEICLWIAVSYATVIVFEVVKVWHASGKAAKHAFLGGRE